VNRAFPWVLAAFLALVLVSFAAIGCGGESSASAEAPHSTTTTATEPTCPPALARGWQKLADQIDAAVYCPSWLPDPLVGRIGGQWEGIHSVTKEDSYLIGFIWFQRDAGEVHVNLRGYPGETKVPSCNGKPCFSGERPFNRGLFHTGCGGGPTGAGEKSIFSLNTSIQSIGEGNYGRLGAEQQKRYTDANVETMFGEPAANGEPDEQPGAMPEILPSPDFGKNIDRCWTCRSMFMQAWGNYGTAWPVVHQWLGVRPDLGRGRLEFVPQVPQGQSSVRGEDIRLGYGSADVLASHTGSTYETEITTSWVGARSVEIGHTLPRGIRPVSVVLDGRPVHHYELRQTNRGNEVTVGTTAGHHTLFVTA